jgi:hypothetical protein
MNDLFKNPFRYLIDTILKYSSVYYIPVIIIGTLYYRFDSFPVYETEKLISLVLVFTCARFLVENWENLNREKRVQCLVLVLIVECIVIVSLWDIFYPFFIAKKNEALRNLVLILLGAPYALFILHWWDMNKKEDIKSAKDANRLTDFHKIQEWASTKEESELKVVALFQLRPYINGEYGEGFKRLTIELFRTLLEAWKPEIKPEKKKEIGKSSDFPKQEKITIPHSIAAIHSVIREEGSTISKEHLSHFNLQYADLSNCDLRNSILSSINFNHAILINVQFQNSNLNEASFQNTNLTGTNFNHSILNFANLTGSSFSNSGSNEAFFDNTLLSSAIWKDGRKCREGLVGAPQSDDDFIQTEVRN